MTRRLSAALLAGAALTVLVGTGPAAGAAVSPATPYDVDGDGHQELVAAAPGLTVDGAEDAGGVVVVPTSRTGLAPKDRRLLTQATKGILWEPEEYGYFGSGVASADFNRDGYADLVVATPDYVGYGELTERLSIIPGSPSGLKPAATVQLGNLEDHDDYVVGLGDVLAVGDFTGDGYPDLATGIPWSDRQSVPGAKTGPSGEVQLFAGGPKGLGETPPLVIHHQGHTTGYQDWDSGFGSSLAAADLDGDGTADLVVGSAGEEGPDGRYPGSVSVCPGTPGGPTVCTRLLHSADVAGRTSLAVGPVTGGTRPDVVVASPRPSAGGAGSLRILQLKADGPIAIDHKLVLSQDSTGVPGTDEPGDAFGSAVAVGDLDGDGFADLVVGAPGEDHGRGRVTVVHGASGGWRSLGNTSYGQDTTGVPGKAERNDRFGSSVTLLDHDGDGHLDLDVGSPGENGSGLVTTFRGIAGGFTTKGSTAFSLKSLEIRHGASADFGDPLGQ